MSLRYFLEPLNPNFHNIKLNLHKKIVADYSVILQKPVCNKSFTLLSLIVVEG